MTEVWFYHLTERTLEQTLPALLEKCMANDWRSVIQFGDPEKLEAMDNHLWTYRDESFLAHSAARDGREKDQPIFLTSETDNPNDAQIRFMVDGAEPTDMSGYTRAIYIFDGHNEAALANARERWKEEKAAGHEVTYWQQKENGSWEKKA